MALCPPIRQRQHCYNIYEEDVTLNHPWEIITIMVAEILDHQRKHFLLCRF